LINQFGSLERRTSPSGKDKIDHGPGGNDDVANAAAGAMVLTAKPRGMEIPPGFVDNIRRLQFAQRHGFRT
jgi:hypothetical protein